MIEETMEHAFKEAVPQIGQKLQEASQPIIEALSGLVPTKEETTEPQEAPTVTGEGEVADPEYVPKPKPDWHVASTVAPHFEEEKKDWRSEYPFTASYVDSLEKIKLSTTAIEKQEQEDKADVNAYPAKGRKTYAKKLARLTDADTLKDRSTLSEASNEVYVRGALANKLIRQQDIWVLPFLGGMHKVESNYAVEKTHKGAEGGADSETSSYGVVMNKFPIKKGETMLSQAVRYALKKVLPHFKNKEGKYKNPNMSQEERDVRASLMWNKGGSVWADLELKDVKHRLLSYIIANDKAGIPVKLKDKVTGKVKDGAKKGVSIGVLHRGAQNYNRLIEATSEGADSPIKYYEIEKKKSKDSKIVGVVITYTFEDDTTKKLTKPYRIHTKNMRKGDSKFYTGRWTPEGEQYGS